MNKGNGDTQLIRIGVFYDGNYFLHVSNYYNYEHERKSRISIHGLHNYVRQSIAKDENILPKYCQVVDAHYFRGRESAALASQNNRLYADRVFEDILMAEGVITHYLPLRKRDGVHHEKGIDVWLALEAFELTVNKMFNVVVLIAADGDYIPLIRKLNSLGTKVMVLGWDFEYITSSGVKMVTKTSKDLMLEVTYPLLMADIINNKNAKKDPLINNLFSRQQTVKKAKRVKMLKGKILNIRNGFGFIAKPPNNLFFHYTDVIDGDFNDLKKGDDVKYTTEKNDKNQIVAKTVLKVD